MNCRGVEPRLSAYLDGELDDAAASAVRGHLRLCPACRQLSERHAAAVDAIAQLEVPEPPAEMWDGVLARLGAAEVADARRPSWWLWWSRLRPQLLPAAAMSVVAATAVLWMWKRGQQPVDPALARIPDRAALASAAVRDVPFDDRRDAVIALGEDGRLLDDAYRSAADELLALIALDRQSATGPGPAAAEVDARVAALRAAVDGAEPGEARERAWQALIAYLQRVVTSDRVAYAAEVR